MAAKSKPTQTAAELLTNFKQYTMAHPKLKTMHEQVLRAIREPAGSSLLFILGPTGVGKTTLISRLMQQITLNLLPELEQDRERIAVAGIEAEVESLRLRLQQRVPVAKVNRDEPESNGRYRRHPGERRPRRDPVGKK